MGILGFILFLVVAAACAWVGNYVAGEHIPGGFFTAAVVGVVGGWVGGQFLGSFGPSLEGVTLVPTIVGSAVLVFCLAFMAKLLKHHGKVSE